MNGTTVAIALALAIVGGSIIACGDILGLNQDDPPSQPPPTTSGTTIPSEAGVTSTGFIDLDANVARCSTTRTAQATDLFVTINGSMDRSATCTKDQPCGLTKAIENAAAAKTLTIINLGPGTYAADIIVPAHTHLAGGWRADWTFECDQKLAVLQGVDDNRTVRVTDAADTRLILLTVQTPTRPAKPSESFYGVFATGIATDLTLENVAVGAGSGGVGNNGARGSYGGENEPGCADNNGTVGPSGGDGPAGAHAICDVFGCRMRAAMKGTNGENGRGGTQGALGQMSEGAKCGGVSPNCVNVLCTEYGERGKAGCGGGGGVGGAGGESGGGSFGVYAWNGAKVTVLGGLVASANAGAGGAGGVGGDGGIGSMGAFGADLQSSCLPSPQCDSLCQPLQDTLINLNGGTPGGPGGNGGLGGRGGGGAGGLTFTFASSMDAKIELKDVRTAFGTAGAGGAPNGVVGKAGERGP
jgi:hypothetical protein